MSLQISTSQRFIKAYTKASISLQGLAEGCVHDFIRRWRSNPKTVSQSYDKLAGFGRTRILEIDITGAHRMLAKYIEGQLTLLDMGGHEIVNEYSKNKYIQDTASPKVAPKQFLPEYKSDLFLSLPDKSNNIKYQAEASPDWLFFLEDEQEKVLLDVINDIETYEETANLILGGPGTGKTCIILNLFKWFIDSDYKVGLSISDKLVKFIEQSTYINISDFCVDPFRVREYDIDILLIDDPSSLFQITLSSKLHTVAAFDPLQLSTDITDEDLERISSELNANMFSLSKCYRQKENVGTQTKKIIDTIAASTPFLDKVKIQDFREARKQTTTSSNDLKFVNPNGYVQKYPGATPTDVQIELMRIILSKHLFWKHAPSILILLLECTLPPSINKALDQIRIPSQFVELTFNRIEDIKGLEFQHVLIFINQALYNELHKGFKGAGQKNYNNRRLLRIPFSRAKDSVVVFCVD